MSWWSEVRERARGLFHGERVGRELEDEMRFHLEMEAERLEREEGVGPEEALRRAAVAFGGVEAVKEQVRDARGVRPLQDLVQDIRYALRGLRRNPGFATAAVLVLALGIGANTAIFAAVNAVVLEALPFAHPDRLYMLWEENPEKGWDREVAAPANYYDWKEGVAAFEDMASYSGFGSHRILTGVGDPQMLLTAPVTGNFFSVLGVKPALGRTFRPEETWKGSEPIVVLSDHLWKTRFGGDRSVIDRVVRLDGEAYRVVGVMPASFSFPSEKTDLWVPWRWDPANRTATFFRRAHWIRVIGRLAPGATATQANSQLQSVVSRLKVEYPETNRYMGAGMTPLHEFLVGDTRTPLLVLLGAVGLLLLIACANVANLLLVRAAGRQREVAVRAALGAGRLRLVRQVLTESLVLSVLGGATGLLLGWEGTRLLEHMQPEGLLRTAHFGLDVRVAGYILAITTVSGLLFGLAPALWTRGAGTAASLREGGRSGGPGRATRALGSGLVVAEIALAMLLVTGAGLLVRSYQRLLDVNPGFDPHGVLAVTLSLPGTKYDTGDKVSAFFGSLLERVHALPGVEDAALTSDVPLEERGYSSDYSIEGRGPDEYGTEVVHRRVTPQYLNTMRVPLLRGRFFTDADRKGGDYVVVINEALAREAFPGQDPIGHRIAEDKHPDSTSVWRTIVGVVGNERQEGVAMQPQIEVLAPFYQDRSSYMTLMIRTAGDPSALVAAVRHAVADLDSDLPLSDVRTMEAVRADSLARERFLMTLLLAFAAIALTLAVVGVYGVTAQAVRQRTQEIGVRMALGAQTRDVLRLVMRQGARLAALGVVIGLGSALLASKAMRALLYDVAPNDPLTFVTVGGVLAAAALVASWVPALRASRTDPTQALRVE